jgi:16S rRNA (cytosine967-C5)-methyltransferase
MNSESRNERDVQAQSQTQSTPTSSHPERQRQDKQHGRKQHEHNQRHKGHGKHQGRHHKPNSTEESVRSTEQLKEESVQPHQDVQQKQSVQQDEISRPSSQVSSEERTHRTEKRYDRSEHRSQRPDRRENVRDREHRSGTRHEERVHPRQERGAEHRSARQQESPHRGEASAMTGGTESLASAQESVSQDIPQEMSHDTRRQYAHGTQRHQRHQRHDRRSDTHTPRHASRSGDDTTSIQEHGHTDGAVPDHMTGGQKASPSNDTPSYPDYIPEAPRRKMFIPKGPVDDRYPEFRVNNELSMNREEDPLYHGARGIAIRILSRYDQADVYLDKLLEYEQAVNTDLNALDRALLTELVYGVTRWQSKLDWVLTGFYHGEFVKCIIPVKNAMRIALYQMLMLTKIPPFAAVNESVEIVKRLKGTRSANLVNAVLRNILQNIKNIRYPGREEDVARYAAVMYSHPLWMVKRWVERFGAEPAEKLLIANNERPKVTLRLNAIRATNEQLAEYLEGLKEHNIKFVQSPYEERSYMVNSLAAVREWEPFQNGWFSVQDVSASLVVRLVDPKPDEIIYDVCAAPGGKTTFMAELMGNSGRIIAVDKYDGKLKTLKENTARLGITNVKTICQDARTYHFDTQADTVLVDAPCSGLGTLAKHPDIKWKREKDSLKQLVHTQKELLTNAVHMVKSGGTLVYSTCSTEPEENTAIAEWFLATFPEFTLERAEAYLPADVCLDGYLQTFPHIHNTDGAFGARFIKQ